MMKREKTGVWLTGIIVGMLLWCAGLTVSAQEPVQMAAIPDAAVLSVAVAEAQAADADTGLILMQATACVKVRTEPSIRSGYLGMLKPGEQVISAENADGWFAVVWQDQVGYVKGKYLSPVVEASSVPEQEETVSGQGGEAALQAAQLPEQEGVWPGAPLVFIGDSRFVQMKEAVGPTPWAWIAESGRGYDWFVEKGLSRADNVIGTNSRVIINLGVNDVRNADKYIALFNRKAIEWTARGARVYYASVNPVWTNPYVTKEQVEAFNLKLQMNLNPCITWVDSYSYLQTVGCRIVDGLHYDTSGYQVIYAYYMEMCP